MEEVMLEGASIRYYTPLAFLDLLQPNMNRTAPARLTWTHAVVASTCVGSELMNPRFSFAGFLADSLTNCVVRALARLGVWLRARSFIGVWC